MLEGSIGALVMVLVTVIFLISGLICIIRKRFILGFGLILSAFATPLVVSFLRSLGTELQE